MELKVQNKNYKRFSLKENLILALTKNSSMEFLE